MLSALRRLTARELEVLRRIAEGDTNATIAETLYLSEHTINQYVKRLLVKLGAKNRFHAVTIGFRTGLLT